MTHRNLLDRALDCATDDEACGLIQDALGIEDGGIASYSLPAEWPADRHGRALALREWLGNELLFLL